MYAFADCAVIISGLEVQDEKVDQTAKTYWQVASC